MTRARARLDRALSQLGFFTTIDQHLLDAWRLCHTPEEEAAAQEAWDRYWYAMAGIFL